MNAKALEDRGSRQTFVRSPFGDATSVPRLLALGILYVSAILAAHWVAYLIRFEFHPPAYHRERFWWIQRWSLLVELVFLIIFGQFRTLLSYFSLPDARRIVFACGSSAVVSVYVWYGSTGLFAPPRSIIVLCFILDALAIGGIRVAIRLMRERQRSYNAEDRVVRRVIIIGAGDVGAHLVNEMKQRRDLFMVPIAFFDDDKAKWNSRVHGVPVVGPVELLREKKIRADEAVIAMPSASGFRVRQVVQFLNEAKIKSEILPSLEQMVNGHVKVSQIRPVQIEDLLGREKVSLETEKIRALVAGKTVMVTGAGGSIGSELCRQILKESPKLLLLVERCEVQIYQIEQALLAEGGRGLVVPLVADVLSAPRMRSLFERYRPHIIFHAAAHKHVPMMEHQPMEAFLNNTIGTRNMIVLAADYQVERFILVSTDKAINPTNTMGATKRLAELYLQAAQNRNHTSTKFMAVRFGNVLGSSGSVIPTFKRQIDAGGPVTVTDPKMSRYFMTVHEAVGLVLQSASQGLGGEIFALDMGKRVKILDLAQQLIELSGLRPGIDIEIKITGIRPGEKLYEEINHDTENLVATDHPKIMRFIGEALPMNILSDALSHIELIGMQLTADQVKLEIRKLIPEYKPHLDVPLAGAELKADTVISGPQSVAGR